MKKLLVLLSFTLLATMVQASGLQSDTIVATLPTTYTDGSAILPGELQEVVIYWGTSVNGPYPNVIRTAVGTGPTVTVDVPRTAPYLGRRCYVATAVAGGIESDATNEVCKNNRKPGTVRLGIS